MCCKNPAPFTQGGLRVVSILALAGLVAAVRRAGAAVTAGRCELGSGEGNLAEHFAGILGAAGAVAAFLGRQRIIQHRNDQLRIPLQTDDGELTQCDEHPATLACIDQLIVKLGSDGRWDLHRCIIPAPAVADLPDLGAEHHRIQHLHHSGGAVDDIASQAVGLTDASIAAINVGLAVLAAQHCPFGKHSQTVQRSGAVGADGGIGENAVVEGYIDAVVIPVKCHRLHINVCVQQLGAAHPGTGRRIQQALRASGHVNPKILDAVLVAAGVGDLSCVNGHGLPQILGIAAQGVLTILRHDGYLPIKKWR